MNLFQNQVTTRVEQQKSNNETLEKIFQLLQNLSVKSLQNIQQGRNQDFANGD